jgi:hypothetical protein
VSREIPDRLVQKYHHAVYAIDLLGTDAKQKRDALRSSWAYLQLQCATNTDGPQKASHEMFLDKLIAASTEAIDAFLAKHEKDKYRPDWQKQRDFLVGTMKRVRRATTLDDTDHLHFYGGAEIFDAKMDHARFQVGYTLWQGIRTEMKTALSLTLYSQPVHPAVAELHAAIRRIITALESADVSKLNCYDPSKSALHLSEEQQGRMLWEAVREEIGKTVVMAEARVAA